MKVLSRWLCIVMWLLCAPRLAAQPWPAQVKPVVRIGVITYGQVDAEMGRWQGTIDYLNERLPQYQFLLVMGDVRTINQLVASSTIDFVISNGFKFLDYQQEFGAVRLLSLTPQKGRSEQVVGSVAITRMDAPAIDDWRDLKERKIIATSPEAFGGFQIMQGLWLSMGINPVKEFSSLFFVGLPQEDLLRQVAQGRADIAILPTCILESQVERGRYVATQFRVVKPMAQEMLPCQSSTPLYPSISLAKLRHVNDNFARDLAKVLLEITPTMAAATSGYYQHWSMPVNDASVRALWHEIERANALSLTTQFWLQYRGWLLIGAGVLLLFIGYHLRVNYLIQLRTRQLSDAINDNLLAAEQLQQQQYQLFSVQRGLLSGELAAGLAHELNQPLMALNNYLAGCRLRLERSPPNLAGVEEGLSLAMAQVTQAKQIITRLRRFMGKGEVHNQQIALDELLRTTLPLLQDKLTRQQIDLQLPESEGIDLWVDPILIQQVLVNLICNGVEALALMPHHEAPTINISYRLSAGRAIITVADNGTGLSDQQKAHLFVPFYTNKADGLGLGLTICKRIIESYHGEIWPQACPQGTAISFSLPIYPQPDAT